AGGDREAGSRLRRGTRPVHVQLLLAEAKRDAPAIELDDLGPEHVSIEGGRPLPVADGDDGMVETESVYFATSIARDSRMTITFTCPGYSSWSSISRAISWERSTAPSSSTSLGSTMTRISRPACRAYAFATPAFADASSSRASSRRM